MPSLPSGQKLGCGLKSVAIHRAPAHARLWRYAFLVNRVAGDELAACYIAYLRTGLPAPFAAGRVGVEMAHNAFVLGGHFLDR